MKRKAILSTPFRAVHRQSVFASDHSIYVIINWLIERTAMSIFIIVFWLRQIFSLFGWCDEWRRTKPEIYWSEIEIVRNRRHWCRQTVDICSSYISQLHQPIRRNEFHANYELHKWSVYSREYLEFIEWCGAHTSSKYESTYCAYCVHWFTFNSKCINDNSVEIEILRPTRLTTQNIYDSRESFCEKSLNNRRHREREREWETRVAWFKFQTWLSEGEHEL